ncbi:HAD family hydrolase [endosymbiont of Ridgeia piscesae]|jgi:phosphoglycolate phosphatase|uniref:Phosphoglycolate phosphatase n=1 Tax=endosymbiont of Ridgeia piscesae TaxID=54398 RepID=A0A0T5ZAX2_9GAMM|nr:HAD-IA family hydrolase [endosymbiont of Ridgeia piscesae]KRT55955.1 phosphoglycolate phosphatase [endosymbiont of Ridgeia piscesae]KRT59963.1 phosphoglycolate phosphatase [endosymbiont of Ridgeia piscesae]
MTIRCVLFDLDGTFADTAPDLHQALNRVRAGEGLPPMPFAQVRPAVSHGSQAMIRVGFGLAPGNARYEALRRAFLDDYLANIAVHTRLFDGMEPLLDALQERHIPWGIVTNKPAWLTEPLMRQLAWGEQAACIVSGDTAAHPKPHPAPIYHACQQVGVEPFESLYVGDAERDIEAGRNAGTLTLAALFGYLTEDDRPESWHADGLIRHPLEILDWIE